MSSSIKGPTNPMVPPASALRRVKHVHTGTTKSLVSKQLDQLSSTEKAAEKGEARTPKQPQRKDNRRQPIAALIKAIQQQSIEDQKEADESEESKNKEKKHSQPQQQQEQPSPFEQQKDIVEASESKEAKTLDYYGAKSKDYSQILGSDEAADSELDEKEKKADQLVGDDSLVDPNEMQRLLITHQRYARHAMLIAEQKREDGLSRNDSIRFLSNLFLDNNDHTFARKALKEFGPQTGIIDMYPLEVISDIITLNPDFLPKTAHAPFAKSTNFITESNDPVLLEYPQSYRIRGFAVKGGDKIGYLLQPLSETGKYHLIIQKTGLYHFLLSATDDKNNYLIDEIKVEVVDRLEKPAEQKTDTVKKEPNKKNVSAKPQESVEENIEEIELDPSDLISY